MQRVCRRSNEPEVGIELACGVILGVDDEGANTGDVGSLKGSLHRIFQKAFAHASAVPWYMHR